MAIEAKSAAHVADAELRGLQAVKDLPGVCRRLVVYGGARAQRTPDGIEVLPVADFLRLVEGDWLFP